MGISLSPETYVSGGIIPEGVYRITGAHFEQWDYDGKGQPAVGCMAVLTNSETGEKHDRQFWSVGAPAQWNISQDAQELLPVGTTRGIRDNSNFAELLGSARDAGYPVDKMLTDRVGDILDGLLVYMIWKKAEGRENMTPQAPRLNPNTGQPYPVREPQVFTVAEIKEYPWDVAEDVRMGQGTAVPQGPQARPQAQGPATRGRGQTPRQTAAMAPAVPDGSSDNTDAVNAAYELIAELASTAGGPVERGVLVPAAVQKFVGSPLQPKVMGVLVSSLQYQKWQEEGLVVLEGSKVGLPGQGTA